MSASNRYGWGHAQLLSALLPPISYAPCEIEVRAAVTADGQALDAARDAAADVLAAISPLTCREELLDDYERLLGLPSCPWLDAQSRRYRIILKINLSPARLDADWFIWLASLVGYTIQITEEEYFMCDYSEMDLVPFGEEWTQFIWNVVGLEKNDAGVVKPAYLPGCGLGIEEPRVRLFLCDYDTMDDTPFAVDEAGTLQALFTTLKPAQTEVRFI